MQIGAVAFQFHATRLSQSLHRDLAREVVTRT
jgi:hypothetical protein